MCSEARTQTTDLLALIQSALAAGEPVTLATVVEVQGASPAQPGFKLLVSADGSSVGNVGGGAIDQRVRTDALSALAAGRPKLVHYRLTEDDQDALGMLCGGDVSVFIEPFGRPSTLLIVGGGHIGQPLAELARVVGYEVQIVDVRPERGEETQFDPHCVTPSTHIVLITENHVSDEAALRLALGRPAGYIGMIGSRHKVAVILEHLRAEGFAEPELERVRAPIGLDLGGREPAEIALAILAEIEMLRHGGRCNPRSGRGDDV